jgi:hypothetical protein
MGNVCCGATDKEIIKVPSFVITKKEPKLLLIFVDKNVPDLKIYESDENGDYYEVVYLIWAQLAKAGIE